jgi:hypothetical protein
MSKPLIVTAYVWAIRPCWLRHAGKCRKFRRISDARDYAESVGRKIRVKLGRESARYAKAA